MHKAVPAQPVHGRRDEVKDYEVNYVHQESKTVPDTNYMFETAIMPAHLPRHESPPTHKDVLLKTWAQDTEAMANVTLEMIYDSEDDLYVFEDGFMTSDHEVALVHEVARLNSAAEVGK